MTDASHDNACLSEDIAAYLDGELRGSALEIFETHLSACPNCAAELTTQRQLLCTLDAAFRNSPRFNLPEDFTRVVKARAESDVSGIRKRTERYRALQLCAILALGAFGLLGAASSSFVFQPARKVLHVVGGILDLFWQTIYDAGVGAVVILRMVGRGLLANSYGLGLLFIVIFAFAILLLPRLIANYHRAQI